MNRQRINSIRNHINNSRENRDRVGHPQLFPSQPLSTESVPADSSTPDAAPEERSQEEEREESAPFAPAFADVRLARAILKSLKLPTELTLAILDLAHYWPEQTFSSTKSSKASVESSMRAHTSSACAFAVPFLEPDFAEQFGSETPKLKEIEVVLKSHDQGWTSQGGDGTYETSSSWTELSILHNNHKESSIADEEVVKLFGFNGPPLSKLNAIKNSGWDFATRPESAKRYPQGDDDEPMAWFLQANKVATPITNAKVVWGADWCEGDEGSGSGEGFLDALQPGDKILLWARAKWPGWECHVTYVKITLRYGV